MPYTRRLGYVDFDFDGSNHKNGLVIIEHGTTKLYLSLIRFPRLADFVKVPPHLPLAA